MCELKLGLISLFVFFYFEFFVISLVECSSNTGIVPVIDAARTNNLLVQKIFFIALSSFTICPDLYIE